MGSIPQLLLVEFTELFLETWSAGYVILREREITLFAITLNLGPQGDEWAASEIMS
jgi:hypothetical protein